MNSQHMVFQLILIVRMAGESFFQARFGLLKSELKSLPMFALGQCLRPSGCNLSQPLGSKDFLGSTVGQDNQLTFGQGDIEEHI